MIHLRTIFDQCKPSQTRRQQAQSRSWPLRGGSRKILNHRNLISQVRSFVLSGHNGLILIGIGSNLPGPRFGTPRGNCEGSLVAMADKGIRLLRQSRWYTSAPVPAADVPWYVNGVAAVETDSDPVEILAVLHCIEDDFGRVRGAPNAARPLDLDLLAFHDHVSDENEALIVPHPRMHERAFVLKPLREIAPEWRHPTLDQSVGDLIAALSPEQMAVAIDDEA